MTEHHSTSRHHCVKCGDRQPCGCQEEKKGDSTAEITTAASERSGKKTENGPASEKPELLMGDILVMAQDQGYLDFSKIERKDDCYKVQAKSASGEKVEICFDAKTGETVKRDGKDKSGLSKKEVIARLKEQGYPEVSRIKRKGGEYRVMTRDAVGKKSQLHINAKTGEIVCEEQKVKG